ncbi:MAG: hypothetical protein WC273_02995 [Dehalococcoidia bacterium]
MPLRLHHVMVIGGLVAGIVAARFMDTDPPLLGWLFAVGAGLAGGAFLAAIVSGDALAGGPPPGGPDAPGHPAWFDEDEATSTPPDDSRD